LNTLQEAVGHSCLKMCCFVLGSVESGVTDDINYVNFSVEYSFLFPPAQKNIKNLLRNARVIIKTKVGVFF